MNNPNVLIFDIENAPMTAYVWGRYDQNIAINQIKSDKFVMAWAAKKLGDPPSKVIYKDQRHAKDIENDKPLLVPLWKLLNEADVVITQNGKRFDSRVLNSRFIMHGMMPPKPYTHWDTLQLARRVADFTSNSLEYLTDKLCTKYKKLDHAEFPGMELWKACLAGNPHAWEVMKKYNIHDVLSTEELALKLRAWAPASFPQLYYTGEKSLRCGTCGTGKLIHEGFLVGKTGKKQRYKCHQCGTWSVDSKIIKEAL